MLGGCYILYIEKLVLFCGRPMAMDESGLMEMLTAFVLLHSRKVLFKNHL